MTFLVSLPTCTFVGLGDGLRRFRSFSSLLGGLDLERDRLLLSCLRRDGLGDPEELLELELREVLELPERLEAEEELEPLLEPVLELDPELEVELERDLVLLLPLEALRLLRVLSRPRSFSPDSLVAALSLDRSFDFSSDLSLRLVGEGALLCSSGSIPGQVSSPEHCSQAWCCMAVTASPWASSHLHGIQTCMRV